MAVRSEVEQCLKKLINLGKRQRGYLAFEDIAASLGNVRDTLTLSEVDYLSDGLEKAAIKIVDQLPAEARLARFSVKKKTRVLLDEDNYFAEDEAAAGEGLCPEEAIDLILYRWLEKGWLSVGEIKGILKKCNLNRREIREVIEFLAGRGVEIFRVRLLERVAGEEVLLFDFDEDVPLIAERIRRWGRIRGHRALAVKGKRKTEMLPSFSSEEEN